MRISTERIRDVFDYDENLGKLIRKVRMGHEYPGIVEGTKQKSRTVVTKVDGKRVVVSRVIWQLIHGDFDETLVVDHINGDWTDNRLSNLRLVPQYINGRNLKNKSNNTSGYPGVYWKRDKNKWCVEVWVLGKKHFFGHFSDFESAKRRRIEVQKQFGYHKNHGRVVQ